MKRRLHAPDLHRAWTDSRMPRSYQHSYTKSGRGMLTSVRPYCLISADGGKTKLRHLHTRVSRVSIATMQFINCLLNMHRTAHHRAEGGAGRGKAERYDAAQPGCRRHGAAHGLRPQVRRTRWLQLCRDWLCRRCRGLRGMRRTTLLTTRWSAGSEPAARSLTTCWRALRVNQLAP